MSDAPKVGLENVEITDIDNCNKTLAFVVSDTVLVKKSGAEVTHTGGAPRDPPQSLTDEFKKTFENVTIAIDDEDEDGQPQADEELVRPAPDCADSHQGRGKRSARKEQIQDEQALRAELIETQKAIQERYITARLEELKERVRVARGHGR